MVLGVKSSLSDSFNRQDLTPDVHPQNGLRVCVSN